MDEVDSILIDEARTPLIISGEPETAAKTYYDFARDREASSTGVAARAARRARSDGGGADYIYDEKHKTVSPRAGRDREGRARAQASTTSTTRATSSSSTT